MSVNAAALRKMAELGLTVEQIVDLVETMEEGFALPVPQLSAGALRQRRYRERRSERTESVTCDVTRDVTEDKKVSPTPPSKNQNNLPPIPPLKGGTFPLPAAEPKPAKPKADDLAQRLWVLANKTSRDRSGRPALGKAVLAAIRKGATDAALEASVREHCREQGEFAKGVHRIVEGEHWRDHLPSQAPPPKPADAEVIARRLQHYRDTGEWRPDWGPPPEQAAA
jgi:hypothetical protein